MRIHKEFESYISNDLRMISRWNERSSSACEPKFLYKKFNCIDYQIDL